MDKCPWCGKYIEWYLKDEWYQGDDVTFTKEEFEEEKERINAGFWASVEEIQHEEKLVNKLGIEAALKLGSRVFIDMKSGETSIRGFECYELARIRDKVFGQDLEHYWIQSGACSISFRTAICCEHANATSYEESIEWEMQEFDLKSLTDRIAKYLKEEHF